MDIICADSIDAVGDVNLNGLAYEIADAVMFTNYFIQGLSAFPHPDGSMAASDVNGDGISLTVADLVQLIRVVVGDASPLPKVSVEAIHADMTNANGVLSIESPEPVAAAYISVAGDVLTIKAERLPEESRGSYHRRERAFGGAAIDRWTGVLSSAADVLALRHRPSNVLLSAIPGAA